MGKDIKNKDINAECEKRMQKLRAEFNHKTASQQNVIEALSREVTVSNAENVKLNQELEVLKEKYEQTLKISGRSDEDIKKLIKGSEAVSELMGITRALRRSRYDY